MTSTKPAASWRDTLSVHPACELFPLMSSDELRVLGEDILAAASPKKMTTKSLAREDIGPNSLGEVTRLNALVEELQNEKRRLEIENLVLRSEIEKLTATNNSLRQQVAELIAAQAKFDNAAQTADDGGMPDIPASLRRQAMP